MKNKSKTGLHNMLVIKFNNWLNKSEPTLEKD